MQTKLRVLEDGIGSIANDDSVKSAKFNDDIEKVKGNVERLGKYVSEFNDELDLYKNKAGKDRELLNNVISLARNAYTKVDSVANEVNNLNTKVSKVQDISHNINMPNY
jgi:methyl-accepting chemotaxis protein